MELPLPWFSTMFLKGNSCQVVLYARASPAHQSYYQRSKASTNSCLANIVLHLLFKAFKLGSNKVCFLIEKQQATECIRKSNMLTSRNINHALRVPLASDCDVGGNSTRLFVCMSHVLGQLVFSGAVGLLQPGWGHRIPEGREEAVTSHWIIFSWQCSNRAVKQAEPHFLVPAVSREAGCVSTRAPKLWKWLWSVKSSDGRVKWLTYSFCVFTDHFIDVCENLKMRRNLIFLVMMFMRSCFSVKDGLKYSDTPANKHTCC